METGSRSEMVFRDGLSLTNFAGVADGQSRILGGVGGGPEIPLGFFGFEFRNFLFHAFSRLVFRCDSYLLPRLRE